MDEEKKQFDDHIPNLILAFVDIVQIENKMAALVVVVVVRYSISDLNCWNMLHILTHHHTTSASIGQLCLGN